MLKGEKDKMLESSQIIILCIGLIFFILGIEKLASLKGMIYTGLSIMFWIITAAGAMYIEVPSDTSYVEQGLSQISWGMVFVSIIIFVLHITFYYYNRRYAEEEDRLNLALSLRDQER